MQILWWSQLTDGTLCILEVHQMLVHVAQAVYYCLKVDAGLGCGVLQVMLVEISSHSWTVLHESICQQDAIYLSVDRICHK
jgi:hypothetical protein